MLRRRCGLANPVLVDMLWRRVQRRYRFARFVGANAGADRQGHTAAEQRSAGMRCRHGAQLRNHPGGVLRRRHAPSNVLPDSLLRRRLSWRSWWGRRLSRSSGQRCTVSALPDPFPNRRPDRDADRRANHAADRRADPVHLNPSIKPLQRRSLRGHARRRLQQTAARRRVPAEVLPHDVPADGRADHRRTNDLADDLAHC